MSSQDAKQSSLPKDTGTAAVPAATANGDSGKGAAQKVTQKDTKNDVEALVMVPKDPSLHAVETGPGAAKVVPAVRPDEMILVVEDSKPSSAIAALNFRNLGFEVLEFKNGLEAKTKIEGLPPDEIVRIKAIFSDYMMPEMDGFELLEFIRRHPALGTVPFIVCTALADQTTVQRASALAASKFVVKPLTFQKIRKVCTEIFPEKKMPTEEQINTLRSARR